MRQFYVYILSNSSMTLYTGASDDALRRKYQHLSKKGAVFTKRYHFDRCVYYETYQRAKDAFAREKEIKGWSRARKIALIKSVNPTWKDLLPISILVV